MNENVPALENAIVAYGEFLVKFVYRIIERSRRRSLREMWLAARECHDGDELRQRILDYLTEGDLGPILERLLDSGDSLDAWMDNWPTISSSISEIGEWRGNSARLLTSYPDNPALLMTRGLVEALDRDVHKSDEFSRNMFPGISEVYKSGISTEEIERVIGGIFSAIESSLFKEEPKAIKEEKKATNIFAKKLLMGGFESATLNEYYNNNWKEDRYMSLHRLCEELKKPVKITKELLTSE